MRQAAEAVSHSDLGWFFQKYVAGTDEIPWDDFFKTVGLRLEKRASLIADLGFVATRNFDAALVVSSVTPGSAADLAGLSVGDSILEINGQSANGVPRHAAEVRPGETIRLRVRNSGGERELRWKLASRQELDFELTNLDKITPEQQARRAAWLKGEDQPGSGAAVIRTIAMLAFWGVALPFAAIVCFPWTFLTGDIRFLYFVGMGAAYWGRAWLEYAHELLDSTGSIPSGHMFSCRTMSRISIRR